MAPGDTPHPADGDLEPGADLSVTDALVRLSFLVQGVLARVVAEHGLSPAQARLLGILRDRTPGMLDLARHLGLDKSSTTGLVARAEKRGLVRRLPSPHDGRGVLVSLTAPGRRVAEACTAGMDRAIAALTASLAPAEVAGLRALAGRLLDAAPAPAPTSAPAPPPAPAAR